MALKTLLSARAGLEATRGTGVTPTRILYFGEGNHDQAIATIRPLETRNSYFESFRAYPGMERNTLSFSGGLTYDQAIFWANLAIGAKTTPTGGSAPYTYAFTPAGTADDLKSATIQFGYADSIGATRPAWSIAGCVVDELTLDFNKDSDVTFSASVISAKAATQLSAFTGSLTDVATTSVLGTTTQVYIDTTTIGSTADTNIISASWTLTNGYTPLDTLNGTNVATDILRPNARTWSLELQRYYANDTERDLYVAKTPRKVRIESTGPTLGSGTYKLTLDCYGIIDTVSWSDVDGMGVEQLTLVPIYDTTATTDFLFTVLNNTASLT